MRPILVLLAFLGLAIPCQANETQSLEALISLYAQANGVPKPLVERVIARESGFNPRLHGRFWGLMQLLPATARALGYHGRPDGLLDPETNLSYGVLYLANAWRVAGGNPERALRLYSSGYYYEAKRRGRLALIQKAAVRPQATPQLQAAVAVSASAAP